MSISVPLPTPDGPAMTRALGPADMLLTCKQPALDRNTGLRLNAALDPRSSAPRDRAISVDVVKAVRATRAF